MMSLGDRQKDYEKTWSLKLPRRMPVLARIDGISFSQLTKKMTKPHDEDFHQAMVAATTALLSKSAGGVLGYTQSDEITVLLRNDQTFGTEPFLANKVQKLASHLASYATAAFNTKFYSLSGFGIQAAFDCRVWVVPESEVNNNFLWRQQDAFRNCVSSVVQNKLSEKHGRKTAQQMLHGKNSDERQEIYFQEFGLNMNDYPTKYRRGSCVVSEAYYNEESECYRKRWTQDTEIPLFSQDPDYVMDRYRGIPRSMEDCIMLAKNFTSPQEFADASPEVMRVLLGKPWFEPVALKQWWGWGIKKEEKEIAEPTPLIIQPVRGRMGRAVKKPWDYESAKEVAAGFDSLSKWGRGHAVSYQWATKNKVQRQIGAELGWRMHPFSVYLTEEEILKSSEGHASRREWRLAEGRAHRHAHRQGLIEKVDTIRGWDEPVKEEKEEKAQEAQEAQTQEEPQEAQAQEEPAETPYESEEEWCEKDPRSYYLAAGDWKKAIAKFLRRL